MNDATDSLETSSFMQEMPENAVERDPKNNTNVWSWAQSNFELAATLVAIFLAIGIGAILRQFFTFNANEIKYMGLLGELFLRLIKLLILALMFCSLISGIAGLGSSSAGKIATRAFAYYATSTFIATFLGIALVLIIRPGIGQSDIISYDVISNMKIAVKNVSTHDTILDLIRNLFPDNMIEMAFREYETVLAPQYKYVILANGTNRTENAEPTWLLSKLK